MTDVNDSFDIEDKGVKHILELLEKQERENPQTQSPINDDNATSYDLSTSNLIDNDAVW